MKKIMLISSNQLPREIIGLTHEISICKKLSFSAYYTEFPVSGSQIHNITGTTTCQYSISQ